MMVATAVAVQVLEGPNKGEVISLEGRALPFRGSAGGSISFDVRQRVNTVWYPGNDRASQQVLGAEYPPTTFNGVWSARYLSNTDTGPGALPQVPFLIDIFTAICRNGSSVRVSWDRYSRFGVISSFRWTPGVPTGGSDDVQWEFTVDWRGVLPSQPIFPQIPKLTLSDRLIEVAGTLFNVGVAIEIFADSVTTLAAQGRKVFETKKAVLDRVVRDLSDNITQAASLARRLRVNSSLTPETAEIGLMVSRDGQARTGEALYQTADTYHGSQSDRDGMAVELFGRIQRATLVDICAEGLNTVFESHAYFETQLRPELVIAIAAEPGTDLRALALRFYGDADLWRNLARVNLLESSVIPEGLDEVRIPLSGINTLSDEVRL